MGQLQEDPKRIYDLKDKTVLIGLLIVLENDRFLFRYSIVF